MVSRCLGGVVCFCLLLLFVWVFCVWVFCGVFLFFVNTFRIWIYYCARARNSFIL